MRRKKKKQKTTGDALAAIAEQDAGALKFVGDIMESNAEVADRLAADALAAEQREHANTQHELRATQFRLNDTEERIRWLLGGPLPASLRDEIEYIIEDEVSELELRVRP